MTRTRPIAAAALAMLVLAAQASVAQQDAPNPSMTPDALPPGYLPRSELPDSLALLPPPPAEGSAAYARDEEAHAAAASLREARAGTSPRPTRCLHSRKRPTRSHARSASTSATKPPRASTACSARC